MLLIVLSLNLKVDQKGDFPHRYYYKARKSLDSFWDL